MIIEKISEYNIDSELVASYFHDIYQEFVARNDNEDADDFVRYMVDEFGLDHILYELSVDTEFVQYNFL